LSTERLSPLAVNPGPAAQLSVAYRLSRGKAQSLAALQAEIEPR
jgi:hypothetical protein